MSFTKLDYEQVITNVYDEPNNRLRTDAVVSTTGGFEVIINQADDSIAIGDGTTLYTGTTVGPKHGIDVYLLNTLDVSGSEVGVTGNVNVVQASSPWHVDGNVGVTGNVTVIANNLDIRDLVFATDKIDVSGSVISISGTTPISGTVTANQGTSPWIVSGNVNANITNPVSVTGTVTVSSTALDIRHLTFATDKVDVSGSVVSISGTTPISGTVTANQGTSPWVISGTVTASQGGTWNVNNISGTISLPTGASTSALQLTGNASLASIDSKFNSLGQHPTTGSVSIVLASDSANIPISGTVLADIGATGGLALDTTLTAGAQRSIVRGGNKGSTVASDITSTNVDANTQALDVSIKGSNSVSVTGTVAVTQSTSPWVVSATALDIRHLTFANDKADVSGSVVGITGTPAITGTVTANQGGAWNITNITGTISLPTGASTSALQLTGNASIASIDGKLTSLGQKASTGSMPVVIASDQSTIPVSGSLSITGTISTKTALTAASPTASSVGVASASAVATNASRKGLILTNTSNNNISLGFGVAAVLNSGVTLLPGSSFVMDEFNFFTGQVNAIASIASSNLGIQEFNT